MRKDNIVAVDEQVIARNLGTVLLVDDEPKYSKTIQELLSVSGYESESLDDFDQLEKKLDENPDEYPLVFCDNINGQPKQNKISGSEILFKRSDWFKKRKFVMVTGFPPTQITNAKELSSRGMETISKNDTKHVNRLLEICNETFVPPAEKLAEVLTKNLEDYSVMFLEKLPRNLDFNRLFRYERLLKRTKERLNKYLESFEGEDTPYFFINNKTYNPQEMINEIEEDSEVGIYMIDIILDSVLGGDDA
jgi:hypothetical protein